VKSANAGQARDSAEVPSVDRLNRSERRLRRLGISMALLLLAQFVLGMIVNLYVTIPASGNVTGRAAVFLYAHMVLGAALLIVALVLTGLAMAARRRPWLISSAIGAAHDRGVRAPQRARRPAPRAHRRAGRPIARRAGRTRRTDTQRHARTKSISRYPGFTRNPGDLDSATGGCDRLINVGSEYPAGPRLGPAAGRFRRGYIMVIGMSCAGMTEWVVVVGRWLIVANRALLGVQLREELRRMIEPGSSFFCVLVPDTSAAHQVARAASGVLLPGLAWRATRHRGPATGVEVSAQARQRRSQVLADGGLVRADG
jgi:hypothetical protein